MSVRKGGIYIGIFMRCLLHRKSAKCFKGYSGDASAPFQDSFESLVPKTALKPRLESLFLPALLAAHMSATDVPFFYRMEISAPQVLHICANGVTHDEPL